MDWLVISPDLIPIEHAWDALKRQLKLPPPRTIEGQKTVLLNGRARSLVYADKPQTLDHLEDNIRRVIADIRPQMLEKVIENWTSRLDYIRASRGSHMPEIIFRIFVNNAFKQKKVSPFAVRMTSHNRLDDSLRWSAIGRLEAGQSQAEVARWVQVARN
ncbi:hypothetical protein TNCV_1673991 [Trichonephila clavipes]|nr:hypothetical protein TNCV_1673991 [Trichonephila clavipes]